MQQKKYFLQSLLVLIFFIGCTGTKKINLNQIPQNISAIKFINEYDIPYDMMFKNTVVGGLSGIDYDENGKIFYFICDDRSDKNPARFYTANINFSEKGIVNVKFIDAIFLKQANGETYPNSKQNPINTPDPEAIRYNPIAKNIIWTSEGERVVNAKDTILGNPSLTAADVNGKFIESFNLPENLNMSAAAKGPRRNGVLEGMCFADNFKTIFINVEEPLYQDGPRAEVVENNATIRLFKFDLKSKKNIAQYAYKLEPIAYEPIPKTEFGVNGVPDIYNIGRNKFLIIERSFSTGRPSCVVKVFLADISNATDIKDFPSLIDNKNYISIKKSLLFNMEDLGIHIDNIEGVCFGPRLPNGNRSLIFVADNNFNKVEKAQLLLFEVIPQIASVQ